MVAGHVQNPSCTSPRLQCTCEIGHSRAGQIEAMLFCTVLWAAAARRPPGRGGYNANTSCALHRGGHREHCPPLAVVTAPTSDLLLPREQVTECSTPVVDHPALPVQPCSALRRVQTQWMWCCRDQFLPWTGSDAHLRQG